jgi:RNA polymerase sigma-70 factor (ECF subfamily)
MTASEALAGQFEAQRPHLRSVAYGMLGSLTDAEDAVQECWLRLQRSDVDTIGELRGWLTAVIGRICIDMLRARQARRTDYVGSWLPEPLVREPDDAGPTRQAELADMLGMALLIVLESLTPAERLAFVLHDVFAVSFDEIAAITGRSPVAARQLASRARRRVQAAPHPDADRGVQHRVVDAFLAAARAGNFADLLAILAPDAVLRFDLGPAGRAPLVGARQIAEHVTATASRFIATATPVLVNGSVGLRFGPAEAPISVLAFTVVDGRITALDLIATAEKLRHLRTHTWDNT